MPPKSSSSASTATRKKQARKAAANAPGKDETQVQSQTQKKKDKKAPKVKQFIPPPTYLGDPDPVDTLKLGLYGSSVGPERVVMLRKIGKKDPVTIERGLEEWITWVHQLTKTQSHSTSTLSNQKAINSQELVETVPVLTHHFARLALHPSRRVRALTISLHQDLLDSHPDCLSSLLSLAQLEQSDYITSWLICTCDADKAVRTIAERSWTKTFDLNDDEGAGDGIKLGSYTPELVKCLLPLITLCSQANSDQVQVGSSASRKVAILDESFESTANRIRASALEALVYLLRSHYNPEELFPILDSSIAARPDVWEMLLPSSKQEPLVRKAVWNLVHVISTKQNLQPLLLKAVPFMTQFALHSAFSEKDLSVQGAMILGLTALTSNRRELWLQANQLTGLVREDSCTTIGQEDTSRRERTIIDAFFAYLKSGCSANPILLYPALVVILTSFPPSIFTPTSSPSMDDFFHHFWSAYTGYLSRSTGSAGLSAFHRASADCLIFFDKQSLPGRESGLESHFRRMWNLLLDRAFQTQGELDSLTISILRVAQRSPSSDVYVWPVIFETVAQEAQNTRLLRCTTFLNESYRLCEDDLCRNQLFQARKQLFGRAIGILASTSNDDETRAWAPIVTACISDDPKLLGAMGEVARRSFFEFVQQILPSKFWTESVPHHDLFYACLLTSELSVEVWNNVVRSHSSQMSIHHLPRLMEIIKRIECGAIPTQLPLGEMDAFALECTSRILEGDSSPASFIQSIAVHPEPLIMLVTWAEILSRIADELYAKVTLRLRGPLSLEMSSVHLLLQTCAPCFVLPNKTENRTKNVPFGTTKQIGMAAYMVANFWPTLHDTPALGLVELAETLHTAISGIFEDADLAEFSMALLKLLKESIVDPNCQIHPVDLVEAARKLVKLHHTINPPTILGILPVGNSSNSPLTEMIPHRTSPILLMTRDPLVSHNHDLLHHSVNPTISLAVSYDRVVFAILDLMAQDRTLAQAHCWLWEHCLYFGQWAYNTLQLSTSQHIEQTTLSSQELEAITTVVDTNITYLISSLGHKLTSQWHNTATNHLKDLPGSINHPTDPLIILLGNLVCASKRRATGVLAAQSLRKALNLIFRHGDSDPEDVGQWLSLARSMEQSNTRLSLAIIYSVKPYLLSNPSFHQYQNLCAGNLMDVSSAQANVSGLRIVKILCSLAPPLESPQTFLPQQRCIFLLKTLAGWLKETDDEINFEVNACMLELFVSLAPILQTVQGSHWDFMLDVVAINLEEGSWDEEESLVPVWHACLLIKLIQDLSSRNETLYTAVKTSLKESFKLVFDLFVSRPVDRDTNPIIESISRAIEDILVDPATNINPPRPSVGKLIKAIFGRSVPTCLLAYNLAQKGVEEELDSLSVEAELTSETMINYTIPGILLESLDKASSNNGLVSTLLGWLLLFLYFDRASVRLRNAYNTQLREACLVPQRFLPLVHRILNVSDRGKSRDISVWNVSQFNVMFIEESMSDPVALAAFVYCRALQTVPSHIRTWWEECRNKQLSLSVASFISRHFAPILIGRELDRAKEQATVMMLEDEQMTVKVNMIATEVKVTYMVDEESMEIVVKVPAQYPLQSVEVLDVRKVGIPEAMWRAWLLSIQHTIASQNGSIAEALALFKRNVSLHFEGVEACAICYSIISVVDRSLPTKACRTCHNKFHPSCIFKWFSTSHGSSCPLCRSLF